jgi:cytochrome c oxidase subunit 2
MKRLLPLAALLIAGLAVAAPQQNVLLPAGPQAGHILDLWRLTLAICTLVFAAVLGAFLYAIWRAPRSHTQQAPDVGALSHAEPRLRRNVILATAVSAILLVVLIVADFLTDRRLSSLPLKDAVNVEVGGHMWWWSARYGDTDVSRMFETANELVIPVGRPVVVTLKAGDVIHSFWVPNLHGKKDMIPGRTSQIHLRADKPGLYRGQCAEFCGFEHAMMALDVRALPPAEYEAWAEKQRQPAPEPATDLAKQGLKVFLSRTCVMCHTIQGTTAGARVGPDLTHVAGRRMLAAGALPNTPQHLAAWITDPQKIKPGSNMPPTELTPDELQALLAYLGTLK